MRSRPHLLSLGLMLLLQSYCHAQLPPDEALKSLTVSPGLQIELFASEPMSSNPTCFDIDHKGRVWVCEAVNYRRKLRNQPPLRKEGDRIVILEDSKGTGKADRATVFYQSPELMAPIGIAVAKDPASPAYRVYVCQSPDILVLEDRDGDGKADGPPRKLLTGFQGVDHDHGVHGILIGPDNKLYFSVGDQGVRNLQSADGKGPKWSSNSTDCRAGTVWRCNLDGTGLELIAHNFRNNYEPCVDSFGSVFISDNDDDGNQQTRICYVMPGGNYGYHPRGPGQTHWHEEQPGIAHKILRTYFGSPTGMCVYEGTLLPERYRGQLLHTDAGPRQLRCYHLRPQGAGYDVEREDMVQSKDNWFRPSDVCVAPDGSVFIADWYDPGVGGHGMGDTTRGRIYRVTPEGHQGYKVPAVDLHTAPGIVAALASPNLATRHMAMQALATADDATVDSVLKSASAPGQPPWVRARAAWQAAAHAARKHASFDSVRKLLPDKPTGSEPWQVLGLRIQSDWFGQTPGTEVTAERADARRESLLLMRDADPLKVRPLFRELLKSYDGKDRTYLSALNIAAGSDPERRKVMLEDFDKLFPTWDERVAGLVWELRPPAILGRLDEMVADAKLSVAQRGQVIDILASAEDVSAGKALLKVLLGDLPDEVRGRAAENLKLFLPGKWRDLRQSAELNETIRKLLRGERTQAYALTLIGAAERVREAEAVSELARAKNSPAELRREAIQTLGLLPSKEAVKALEAITGSEPALGTLAVQALGQHALFRQNRPGKDEAIAALQKIFGDGKQERPLRQAAGEALASSRDGTIWLLARNDRKELPEDLRPDIARLLRNSPYQDLRNRAMIAFPPPGRIDPKKLPSMARLLARKGNADRGKQILGNSLKSDLQCLKCHAVNGTGGNIGPDLSLIGKKGSRENLFDSILNPSKAIADQYLTWQVETKNGLVVTGLLMEETPDSLTLRDANGKDSKIDKKDIDARVKSPNSLMPSDLLVYMTEDDLVDLVDYLQTLKTPSLAMDSWQLLGPFPNGADDASLDQTHPAEKGFDPKASYPGKQGKVGWRKVKPDGLGYIDLQAFHGNQSDDSMSLLYQEVESPVAQSATVLIGTDDAARLWINGEPVYTSRAHRAAQPAQDQVAVKLKQGTNRILLKITNGSGPHGFYFTLQAEQELKQASAR